MFKGIYGQSQNEIKTNNVKCNDKPLKPGNKTISDIKYLMTYSMCLNKPKYIVPKSLTSLPNINMIVHKKIKPKPIKFFSVAHTTLPETQIIQNLQLDQINKWKVVKYKKHLEFQPKLISPKPLSVKSPKLINPKPMRSCALSPKLINPKPMRSCALSPDGSDTIFDKNSTPNTLPKAPKNHSI